MTRAAIVPTLLLLSSPWLLGCGAHRRSVDGEYARGKYEANLLLDRIEQEPSDGFLRHLTPQEAYSIGVMGALRERYNRWSADVDEHDARVWR